MKPIKKKTYTFTLPLEVRGALWTMSFYNSTTSSAIITSLVLEKYRQLQHDDQFISWYKHGVDTGEIVDEQFVEWYKNKDTKQQ